MTTDRAIEAHAALNVLEVRITTLWQYRRFFRRYPWAGDIFERRELHAELRALVRILRQARRVAREAQERNDPITLAKRDPALALGDHFQGMPS